MDARMLPSRLLGELDFLPFFSLEQAVRDDLALLRSSPLIAPDVLVRGFIYDVRAGLVSELAQDRATVRRPAARTRNFAGVAK
jgi:hypothetical protein